LAIAFSVAVRISARRFVVKVIGIPPRGDKAMEVILQNRDTGLFLREDGGWGELSRDAQIFASAGEALRFAGKAGLISEVRTVVRVQRERHYILMPLLDVC
jgi:hypothetical protein